MESSIRDLAIYRRQKAKEDLETAQFNFVHGRYKAAVNRSYYAMFHALRAAIVLSGLTLRSILVNVIEKYLEEMEK